MNTSQGAYMTTKANRRWRLAAGLTATLTALSVVFATTQLTDRLADLDAPLLDRNGQPMTLAQLAYRFAKGLTPPFIGSRETDAIYWLMGHPIDEQAGHEPPLVPIDQWQNPGRIATVGDMVVLLAQQLRLEPTTSGGRQLAAQDYQNALIGFVGSGSVATYNAIIGLFRDWTHPMLNPIGPFPTSGEQTRSSPGP
jgi:hypothetical protein